MMNFKEYFQKNDNMKEEKGDIQKTLSRLPVNHAVLLKNFKWTFHGGNTLNGDDNHVGYVDDRNKEVAVAAPWNYGREFTILHEVGHKVWEKFVQPNEDLVLLWNKIVKIMTPEQKKDKSLQQEPEEIFCMVYAQKYAKNKMEKFNNPLWEKFVNNLPD